MRYPRKGEYKSFLNFMTKNCNIIFNKKVIKVDNRLKKLNFYDGTEKHYENLISSLPLLELINLLKDVPDKIKEAANKINATKVDLVSIGFNRPDIAKYLWFYIYDEDILPARAYSPNLKSPDNVPENCSSLQFEIYSSKFKSLNMSSENLINHVIDKVIKMGLFKKNDIIWLKLPYVFFEINEYSNEVF